MSGNFPNWKFRMIPFRERILSDRLPERIGEERTGVDGKKELTVLPDPAIDHPA